MYLAIVSFEYLPVLSVFGVKPAMIIIAAVLILLAVLYRYYNSHKWKCIQELPGPKGLPLLGNIQLIESHKGHELYLKMLDVSRDFAKEGIYNVTLFTSPITFIWKPEYVEILVNSSVNIDKSWEYRFVNVWLGTGLLTSTGDKWRHRRKLITPTFHVHILHDFVPVFNRQSRVLVKKLQTKEGGCTFDIFDDIKYCALDVICESAMGTKLNSQSSEASSVAYVQAADRLLEIINIRMDTPWYWPDFLHNLIGHGREQKRLLKIVHDFTNGVIAERLKSFNQKRAELIAQELSDEDASTRVNKYKNLAFLDMLLYVSDNLTKLSMEDIREEVDTFMFEGHDSMSVTINWTIHLVGAHPDAQDTLHQELDEIFGDSDRDVTHEDLKNMRYMECCIKESLRIFPTSPSIGRKLVEDLVLDKYTVPAGTTAVIFNAGSCLDPETFPDPYEFQPERFFPENSKNRHPYSFLPFSAGPRNCIGQRFAMLEMKTILAYIFRNFVVKSCQKREELRPSGYITLRPGNGILVQVSSRH